MSAQLKGRIGKEGKGNWGSELERVNMRGMNLVMRCFLLDFYRVLLRSHIHIIRDETPMRKQPPRPSCTSQAAPAEVTAIETKFDGFKDRGRYITETEMGGEKYGEARIVSDD